MKSLKIDTKKKGKQMTIFEIEKIKLKQVKGGVKKVKIDIQGAENKSKYEILQEEIVAAAKNRMLRMKEIDPHASISIPE